LGGKQGRGCSLELTQDASACSWNQRTSWLARWPITRPIRSTRTPEPAALRVGRVTARSPDAAIEAAAVEFNTDIKKLIAVQRYEIASSSHDRAFDLLILRPGALAELQRADSQDRYLKPGTILWRFEHIDHRGNWTSRTIAMSSPRERSDQ